MHTVLLKNVETMSSRGANIERQMYSCLNRICPLTRLNFTEDKKMPLYVHVFRIFVQFMQIEQFMSIYTYSVTAHVDILYIEENIA